MRGQPPAARSAIFGAQVSARIRALEDLGPNGPRRGPRQIATLPWREDSRAGRADAQQFALGSLLRRIAEKKLLQFGISN